MLDGSFLVILVSTGLFFMLAGLITLKFPPKKINWFYGYRTTSSMKSQERWNFAQRYAAKELTKSGLVLIIIGFLGSILKLDDMAAIFITLGVVIASVVVLYFRVENALKRHFG